MRRLLRVSGLMVIGLLCAMCLTRSDAGPGLYGDEGKDIKSGDIDSQDYWWTRFDMMMLDYAIKQHQPEGRIGLNLVSTADRLKKLSKEYPQHEEIKKWSQKVEDVNKKIDPNAPRGEYFKPGCPWEESNFAQAWVNAHWAKMEMDQNKLDQAYGLYQNVEQNLDILLKPDRMKDYPQELHKWVEDAKPETDKIMDELKEKRQH